MQVTIGLPVYNAEATLAATLRSIFAQTYRDWELIIVDDGSTDGSLEIARAVDDSRVRVVSDGVNRQLSHRLNQIADLACGDLLARMDADDLMHPERIERQVAFLAEHPEVDAVGTAACSIDDEGNPIGAIVDAADALEARGRGPLARRFFIHGSVLARTPWFRCNRYDPDYVRAEDRELWCRTFLDGTTQFAELEEICYFKRNDNGTIKLANILSSYRTGRRIRRRYGPRIVGWPTTLAMIAELHLKGWALRLAAAVDAQRPLVDLQTQPLDVTEEQWVRSALGRVLETPVPGLG